jgi:hypothetical protein
MARSSNLYFKGKCSNCKKKGIPVRRVGSVQCCGLCISAFTVKVA